MNRTFKRFHENSNNNATIISLSAERQIQNQHLLVKMAFNTFFYIGFFNILPSRLRGGMDLPLNIARPRSQFVDRNVFITKVGNFELGETFNQ